MDPWLHLQHSRVFTGASWGWGHAIRCYILEDNRVMPSHQHVLILCFPWTFIISSLTKGSVYCRGSGGRGENSDKAEAARTPFSVKKTSRLPLVSIGYPSACCWELPGRAPIERRSAVQMPSWGKICTAGRWWCLKGLSLWRKQIHTVCQRKDFERLKMLCGFHWHTHGLDRLKTDLNIKYILSVFLTMVFHLSWSCGALLYFPVWL